MKAMKKTALSLVLVFLMMVFPIGDSAGMIMAQAETMVYVTPTGSKYHTHKCGRGTYYQATLSSALARGLTACKKCFGSSGGYSYAPSGSSQSVKTTKTTVSRKTTKPKVSKLVISKSKIVLVKGQSKKLTIKGGAGTTHWSSSNSKVARVSSGKVVAKGKGKATITVKKGSQKKNCKIVVETPKLNKSTIEMDVEDTASLKLSGCSHEVTWASSDDSICDVSEGQLIPYSSGKVTIKAKAHGKVWKCKVVITDASEDYGEDEDYDYDEDYDENDDPDEEDMWNDERLNEENLEALAG